MTNQDVIMLNACMKTVHQDSDNMADRRHFKFFEKCP